LHFHILCITECSKCNFATRGYKTDLAAATRSLTLIAGTDDELMAADHYADAVHAVAPSVEVKLIDCVNHMGIVSASKAVQASLPAVVAFGFFCADLLGHFTARQQGAFWSIYFMLFYTVAGLWFGYAFVAIGLGITVLTLIGYYFVGEAFPLWMAVVNGVGLILGGLWMRRS
jgi:hypothetical protein